MGTTIKIPSPQHRFLEPFKNRVFQYDTKHSNLFLSRYTNQILNAVGDDSIVRGLEISPEVNPSKTGINFTISPGALVQDLTYFEFQKETVIEMDDLADFSDYYIVIYSNYRYIETVYENPLKFEATFYNPRTKRTLSAWNTVNNRIILGVFSFSIDGDHNIIDVEEEDSTIFFEDANVVRNGTFDTGTTEYWTSINSNLSIVESGGALDSAYLQVTPLGDEYQGAGQVFTTKPNLTYEASFYVKADEAVPFEVFVLDKNAIYTIPTAEQIKVYEGTATKKWVLHTFRFNAFSTQTTLVLAKKSPSLDNNIYFDHICSFEYTPTRKRADLHSISMIDGGRIPTTEDIVPVVDPKSAVVRWDDIYRAGSLVYDIDLTQHGMLNSNKGLYLAFFSGRYALSTEYYPHWKEDILYLYVEPDNPGDEIALYYIQNPETSRYKWSIKLEDDIYIYSPLKSQEAFQNPSKGVYLVFFNGELLNNSSYSVDFSRNLIQFDSNVVKKSIALQVDVYFITDPIERRSWSFTTSAGVNAYYLDSSDVDFLSEENGKYMVFLDGKKVKEGNYLVKPSERCITLSPAPAAENTLLRVYYFGNQEPVDETPEDQNFDMYKWKVSQDAGVTEYKVDKSRDPLRLKSEGYYLVFNGTEFLQPFMYSIPGTSAITFAREYIRDGALIDMYFIKKSPAAKFEWKFTAETAGQSNFTPKETEPRLQLQDDGEYMVFIRGNNMNIKLDRSQYNIMYAANTLQVSNQVTIPQGADIYVCFLTTPLTMGYWNFVTVENVYSYSPKDSEKDFAEFNEGEYLLFIDGKRIPSDQYVVDPLKNTITLVSILHHGGNKCELYFIGKE